jgi:hypothetical protein
MQELCPTQGEGPPEPPHELVGRWSGEAFGVASIAPSGADRHVAAKAAAWGYQEAMATITEREQAAADAELEAMLVELKAMHLPDGYADRLRAARRPKPPSDKQQALADLDVVIDRLLECGRTVPRSIRRALEQLPD